MERVGSSHNFLADEKVCSTTVYTDNAIVGINPKLKKATKCNKCKSKLTIVKCECDITFCIKHLHNHNCNHDYTTEYKKKLASNNPRVVGDKFTRI
jgi:hypothetical protein